MYPLKFNPILKSTIWGGEKIIPFKHLNIEQQGKIIAKTLIITFSYQRTFIFFYQLAQIFAGFSSISNNRLIAWDIRNFPTFANLRLLLLMELKPAKI